MDKFINSIGETTWGKMYFCDHIIGDDYDYHAQKKVLSPYFAQFGFKVSMMYADFYSKFSGVKSDRYLSPDLYHFYVEPCLNRLEFVAAYEDKNFYSTLFYDVRQPDVVVKCMGGHYYDSVGKHLDEKTSVDLIVKEDNELIIKPTVCSCEGAGVAKISDCSVAAVRDLLRRYFVGVNGNFTVQRKVEQHAEIGRVNSSSLNTMRLFTYRNVDGSVKPLWEQNFIRFGGHGAVMDNASAGGGVVKIYPDGMLDRRVFVAKSLLTGDFRDLYGVAPFRIPGYQRAVDFVVALHERLPHFDSIGWDVAIGVDGQPIFMEFNTNANSRTAQMVGGPMYGEWLDEVMERVKMVEVSSKSYRVKSFRPGYSHLFPS